MNDRELLEMAAKAAGLRHVDYSGLDYDGRLGIVLVDGIGRHTGDWSPLTDDGDALRLAVKLGMRLELDNEWNRSHAHQMPNGAWVTAPHNNDPFAAARLAIVHAAAEVGKAMP